MNDSSPQSHVPGALFAAVTLFFFSCLAAPPLLAETRYIKPDLEVAIHQAQSATADIVASISMGRAVQVVQDDPEWSLIRLPDGSEGWVRTRFLANAPLLPHGIHAAETATENDSIDLQALFRNLVEENAQLRVELAAWTTERNPHPDGVLSVTQALDESLRQLEELRTEYAVVQIENTVLKKNETIKWFLAGSGTLLLGLFIGRMIGGGARRKKSSLL